jgi:alpha,alpha-trehalase
MQNFRTPQDIFGELFAAVQSEQTFADSKTFVDAVPRRPPTELMQQYRQKREQAGFDLKTFVETGFDLPQAAYKALASPGAADVEDQIARLWSRLSRDADLPAPHSSLIELPNPYVVPGGRFREMYYWDSYFTMLGLARSGKVQLVQDMVDNFAYLIDRIGFIPNGTRSYFCTRSQPPFFVLMVELLAEVRGHADVFQRYLPQLKKEYAFWMSGHENLDEKHPALRRIVKVGDALLNRYWDDEALPRQESYAEDIELASRTTRDDADLYRDIRAACESGWDFSSRWFGQSASIESICTTDILPIDLNSILYRLEKVLGDSCESAGDDVAARLYRDRAMQRRSTIQSLFFDRERNIFCDLFLQDRKPTAAMSLAAAFPLFFELATETQAASIASKLAREFLMPGGWVTTLRRTGQQWDAPNGWAPLQWIVFEGLRNYGFDADANAGAGRWVDNNVAMFRRTGRFMEKYNVEQPGIAATGGEYAVQDGFGWTNGVLLCLLKEIRS